MYAASLLISRLSIAIGYACAPLYLMSLLVAVREVIMRYFFNAPSDWAFEVTLTLCAVAWALSVGYVGQQNRHIAITFLHDLAGPAVRRVLDIVTLVLTALAFAALAYAMFGPALEALTRLERTGSAFNPPMPAILKPILLISACLGVIQSVANLVLVLIGHATPAPEPEDISL